LSAKVCGFSLIGSRTSHALSMEYAHTQYAHIALEMSFMHWVKFEPKFYAQILHQCVTSSLWAKAIILKCFNWTIDPFFKMSLQLWFHMNMNKLDIKQKIPIIDFEHVENKIYMSLQYCST
jgi:hypothetical protein